MVDINWELTYSYQSIYCYTHIYLGIFIYRQVKINRYLSLTDFFLIKHANSSQTKNYPCSARDIFHFLLKSCFRVSTMICLDNHYSMVSCFWNILNCSYRTKPAIPYVLFLFVYLLLLFFIATFRWNLLKKSRLLKISLWILAMNQNEILKETSTIPFACLL